MIIFGKFKFILFWELFSPTNHGNSENLNRLCSLNLAREIFVVVIWLLIIRVI